MQPLKQRTMAKTLTPAQWKRAILEQPRKMLSDSNAKLKKAGILVFSIPAYSASVVQCGEIVPFRTCRCADDCAGWCFAQQGSYLYKDTMVSHTRNLQLFLGSAARFADAMVDEINRKRYAPTVRIHDSGDFFSRRYAQTWFDIARRCPDAEFYIYTKEVHLFKSLMAEGQVPANFLVAFSYGGMQDHLIDPETDRHSKVFATVEECEAAGYVLNEENDLIATDPNVRKIGLVYHGSNKRAFDKAEAVA